MLFSSANWVISKFGEVTYEQIMFHLNMPFASERKLVISYFQNTVMTASIILIVLTVLFCPKYRFHIQVIDSFRNFVYRHRFPLSVLWFVFCLIWTLIRMNVKDMILYSQYEFETSHFYEENYVKPEEAKLTFPKEKRNLILIFMESMESSFAKTKTHDYFNADLISELHAIAKENTNFSHETEIGGAHPIDGTQWTQAGLLAQTCGIPIQLPISKPNWFHPRNGFFPKAYCLYDVLKQAGYEESFLIGSAGSFAGMDKFVETHGNQNLLDVDYFAARDGFKVSFKGTTKLSDKKVFKYAKEELTRLSKTNKPFVFTLMTLDTHYGTWHFEDSECTRKYHGEDDMENVVSCSSYQINNFINWIKAQDFYKDSVVVLVGDHLTMNARFEKWMDRKPINIFMNTLAKAHRTQNRIFTPFDIYPTILESMGIEIEGHRMGLGTSLYSKEPTLTEQKMTVEEMDVSVRKKSRLYDYLLYGKDVYNK